MKAAVNGVQLAYQDEGLGLPLVCVHGFPFDRRVWQGQVEAFKADHRVLVPDLRGFGESGSPAGLVTMAQYAEDLRELLVLRHTGPVVLIGHSMGGYVALAFARHHPELVRGLVLVATKASADSPTAAAGRRTLADKALGEGPEAVVDAMAPRMLAPSRRDPALEARVRALMTPLDPQGAAGALLGMAERPDATPYLAQMTVPALVVAGAEDILIPPEESQKLARGIPGAHLAVLPQAGHLVSLEQPEGFNQALTTWLAQFSPSA